MSYRQPLKIQDASGAKAGAKVLGQIVEEANKESKSSIKKEKNKKDKEEEKIKDVAQDLTPDDEVDVTSADVSVATTNKPFYETGGPINDSSFYLPGSDEDPNSPFFGL